MLDRIKKTLPYVITAVVVIVILIVQFVVLGTNDDFVLEDFLLAAAVNTAIMFVITVTWQSIGKEKAGRMSEDGERPTPYEANLIEYSKKRDEVSYGKLGALSEFCRVKTEELREAKIRAYLARRVIDKDDYESKYKSMTKEELKAVGFNRSQVRAILRAKRKKFRVRSLNPMELMTDSKAKNEYDFHYNEQLDQGIRIGVRVIRSLVMGAVFAILAPKPIENPNDPAVWATFGLMLFAVLSSAFNGYMGGYSMIASTKKQVLKKRTMILTLFLEWYSKQCAKPPDIIE